MKITVSQLQEMMDKRLEQNVDALIEKAIAPYTKIDPSKRPNDYDGEQSRYSKEVTKQSAGFRKSYSQLFNKEYLSNGGFDDEEDLLNAIKSGFDPRLKGLSGGVGSEGGFLLPDQFVARIIDTALEDEIVRPRAMVYGLKAGKGRTLSIPAFEDLNHSTSGISGVTAQWTAEKAQKAETDPKFRLISMKTNKLVCYTKSSDELQTESGISLSTVINGAFSKAVIFYSDVAYLTGSGTGQPLGVLNSNALLTQAAESEQTASTINYDNIIGIFSQLAPSSFKNSVWVASISTLPQLMKLSIEVGLGGEHVRILQEEKGKFYLLGKEILFTEKVPALGSAGCLGLYDFSAYGIVMREGIRLESSIHEGFRNDLTSWRMILNCDGQPTIANSLTCLDGTTVVSPFVQLGAVA
ncbi:hypothetical protein ES703_87275 [subsurface metagenome]